MRTFAIGDIHGCYDELYALVTHLIVEQGLKPEKDRVVFLGDYIDRGPNTKKVLETLIEWEERYPHWQFLYGNHEDLMLDALIYGGKIYHSYDLWWNQGGKETAYSYIPKSRTKYEMAITRPEDCIPYEHIDWLRKRPFYFEDENYFFVHAGVLPNTSLEEIKFHLNQVTNNDVKQAVIWARDLFIDSDYNWGKKVIFGHTARPPFEPIVMNNKIGIDTASCNPKGKLTAIELPTEKFYFQGSFQTLP